MLAEFSIHPIGDHQLKEKLAKVSAILYETGLHHRLGPMGTIIEGDLSAVLAAIQKCHEAVRSGCDRVITTVVLDDHEEQPHSLKDMVSAVEDHLGKRFPHVDMDVQC